jgi:hypothetical protein
MRVGRLGTGSKWQMTVRVSTAQPTGPHYFLPLGARESEGRIPGFKSHPQPSARKTLHLSKPLVFSAVLQNAVDGLVFGFSWLYYSFL